MAHVIPPLDSWPHLHQQGLCLKPISDQCCWSGYPTEFHSCSLGRAGEQHWEFCRDEDHAGPSYLALHSPLCHTELRGHPAPGDRAAKRAGEAPNRQGKSPLHPQTPPAPPSCSSASTHLHPIIPKLPHSSATQKQGGAGAQLMLPPAVTGKLEWPMCRPCAPAAQLMLPEEMNGMVLGSATSYLPL